MDGVERRKWNGGRRNHLLRTNHHQERDRTRSRSPQRFSHQERDRTRSRSPQRFSQRPDFHEVERPRRWRDYEPDYDQNPSRSRSRSPREDADKICIDYRHKRRSSHRIEERLSGFFDDSTQYNTRATRTTGLANDEKAIDTSAAAALRRLQHMSRLDEIEIYKNTTEYKQYNEKFPKGRKVAERANTPDRPSLAAEDWTSVFLQWQQEISNTLVKNDFKPKEVENDEEILMRRQKNIDYCKTQPAYDRYVTLLPKNQRMQRDPKTPDKFHKYSRRGWDGAIKAWKIRMHDRVRELD